MTNSDLMTVEFYTDSAHTDMIGAVYLEKKRIMEGVEHVGKALCTARKMNCVDCVICKRRR